MYLKSLIIANETGDIIRNINFHVGVNLIVDETPVVTGKETGNNVGKTTVLKLVDFCLGAKAKGIYTDPENKNHEHKVVKEFLIKNGITITLILKEDLEQPNSREIVIERNFLAYKKRKQKVNGQNETDDEFDESLTGILFPGHWGKKPTFRQIIAHNIRYSELSLTNTLKHLDAYTRDDEYESLFLFLLGCDFKEGDSKQNLRAQIDIEERFKKRLEATQTKSAYEASLSILKKDIESLEAKRSALNLNPNLAEDLDSLNKVKYEINLLTSEISRQELRQALIKESVKDITSDVAHVDLHQLRTIYEQASNLIGNLQKTFEDLTAFHNNMLRNRITFIEQDLPKLEDSITENKRKLKSLLFEEGLVMKRVTQGDSFGEIEQIIGALNGLYQKSGEYEAILKQMNEVDSRLSTLNTRLTAIDNELFSDEYAAEIKTQLDKFNKHFSDVSFELYDEKYALKCDTKISRNRRVYEFTSFNTNFSSGKKQGEITCFDIAYTLFADEEHIPCMHFLLSDKKELMHDNQLVKIAKLVNAKHIQFVASILNDKLPKDLDHAENIVLKLSQDDKLFRIEKLLK